MTVAHIAQHLETLAPLHYAEDFDNVGLLVGDASMEVTGILVTLDTLEHVVDEAIAGQCNLIVSFHPIIFKGLKTLTGRDYVERTVLKAIKNDIAIFCVHTALDNSPLGVNAKLCQVLDIRQPKILLPKKGTIKKLVTHVPKAQLASLREALFEAGAGTIGNYDHCSFALEGEGSFRPGEAANPTVGKRGETHFGDEVQLHMTFAAAAESNIRKALFHNHPYEEVAYEITTLDNTNQNMGMGMLGTLGAPMEETAFLEHVKERLNARGIRHSALLGRPVQKIAVLGGSGSFAIPAALKQGADVFLTADLKYHQFFQAEGQIVLLDVGHFETEQFTKNLLVDFLNKKIPNFAVTLSRSVTNPIKYF
ncbi:MAG: Nif3-like dinuclear metal center hexameric protein [Bacteroidota bacterium]